MSTEADSGAETPEQDVTEPPYHRVVKEPTTPKEKAIVNSVLSYPEATNKEIADMVEDEIGDSTDPSWVSRVRNEFLEEVDDLDEAHGDADDFDEADVEGDVMLRLERIEDKVDEAVGLLTRLINVVDRIEDLQRDEITDDLRDEIRADVFDDAGNELQSIADDLRA